MLEGDALVDLVVEVDNVVAVVEDVVPLLLVADVVLPPPGL